MLNGQGMRAIVVCSARMARSLASEQRESQSLRVQYNHQKLLAGCAFQLWWKFRAQVLQSDTRWYMRLRTCDIFCEFDQQGFAAGLHKGC